MNGHSLELCDACGLACFKGGNAYQGISVASQDKKEDQDVMPQELTVRVRDGFRVSEGIGVKTIDPTRTGKSKIRLESYRGFQQSKSDQSRVFVQWLRDKEGLERQDRYRSEDWRGAPPSTPPFERAPRSWISKIEVT